MMGSALDHFQAGQLAEAIASATEQVRNDPGEPDARWQLVTYLCFLGDFDRAFKHVKFIFEGHPDLAADALLMHGLMKAEIARRQCFEEGRLPKFTEPPSECVRSVLRACTELPENLGACKSLLDEVASNGSQIRGQCDGVPFETFRDCDDVTAVFFEAITMGGDYYWLPFDTLRSIHFAEIGSPRDILWREATVLSRDGESIVAYFPSLYWGTTRSGDESLMLGRAAEFSDGIQSQVRGMGGKMFWVGDRQQPLVSIEVIEFDWSQGGAT